MYIIFPFIIIFHKTRFIYFPSMFIILFSFEFNIEIKEEKTLFFSNK